MVQNVMAATCAWAGQVLIQELGLYNKIEQPYSQPPDNAAGRDTGHPKTSTYVYLNKLCAWMNQVP